jgi:hypothetical protein
MEKLLILIITLTVMLIFKNNLINTSFFIKKHFGVIVIFFSIALTFYIIIQWFVEKILFLMFSNNIKPIEQIAPFIM